MLASCGVLMLNHQGAASSTDHCEYPISTNSPQLPSRRPQQHASTTILCCMPPTNQFLVSRCMLLHGLGPERCGSPLQSRQLVHFQQGAIACHSRARAPPKSRRMLHSFLVSRCMLLHGLGPERRHSPLHARRLLHVCHPHCMLLRSVVTLKIMLHAAAWPWA